ncbi:hypothetical protein DICVIV_02059 [Dictyocaulus viviparus]|uniref:Uncharacterized protein n=1 Tax=Dictyocaulus viviparus TaxID=29172 RepID=A0A0D8Y4H3_DICVI|nr:hypothetical protein DICVIV_02059 [Dictyocaulus viviparus]
MTVDDILGQFFLSHPDQKLCVYAMNSDPTKQPGVFQDILHPSKKLFREELRQYYTPTRKLSAQSRSTNITDFETPQFDSPGGITRWVQSRIFKFFLAQEGIAGVHLTLLQPTTGTQKTREEIADVLLSCEMVNEQQTQEIPLKSVLVVNGSVASTIEAKEGTTFNLHSSVLSAQLLHFTPRNIHPPDSSDELSSLPFVKTVEHKAKIEIGAVNTLIVMPRPLEMTGKNEFPLYDVLSPCLTTWLHVSSKLSNTVNELCVGWDSVVDMKFAQVLKMALDCTDDRIFNVRGIRNVMLKVKELGLHQTGCPSCLLLHTLLSVTASDNESTFTYLSTLQETDRSAGRMEDWEVAGPSGFFSGR